ncbi:hypothetical protein RvY_15592-2 [Ramazzottius varieornatus]|uniref:Uncharacterized protein n=1 Tax=Ramazzottius varieornatus TaxID=947166 RepID=A0A1D1VWM5_RAMVA|nr:hypothetical protein RvY_15592-2 [Ramazzottius varieornatus]
MSLQGVIIVRCLSGHVRNCQKSFTDLPYETTSLSFPSHPHSSCVKFGMSKNFPPMCRAVKIHSMALFIRSCAGFAFVISCYCLLSIATSLYSSFRESPQDTVSLSSQIWNRSGNGITLRPSSIPTISGILYAASSITSSRRPMRT